MIKMDGKWAKSGLVTVESRSWCLSPFEVPKNHKRRSDGSTKRLWNEEEVTSFSIRVSFPW